MVKIYPIFYILVLYPAALVLNALLGQIQDPPLLVKVDSDSAFINIQYQYEAVLILILNRNSILKRY